VKLTDQDWEAIRAVGGIQICEGELRPNAVRIEAAWIDPTGVAHEATIEITDHGTAGPDTRYTATISNGAGDCLVTSAASTVSLALAGLLPQDLEPKV
jgi:hypothetical protein